MKLSSEAFGLTIAFLLPGFISLWGLTLSFDELSVWLMEKSSDKAPTVGGFLFSTLASLALGLLISAIRWATMDQILSIIFPTETNLDHSKLTDEHTLNAYQAAVENHYRYYQYYSNSLVAILLCFIAFQIYSDKSSAWADNIVCFVVVTILFAGSKDALGKFYHKAQQILGTTEGES